jgi:hypothetical protein
MYNLLLNVLLAVRALEQNARIPHNDCNCFKQNGCGVFFMGKLCYFLWPKKWHNSDILRDMTFLEMLPIALEIFVHHFHFETQTRYI